MKKLFAAAILALSIPALSGCSDDPEPTPQPLAVAQPSQINGQWVVVKASLQQYSANGNPSDPPKTEIHAGQTFSFSGQSVYSAKFQDADTIVNNTGSYSFANNLLNIQVNSQADKWVVIKPDVYVVDTLNENRLVFHMTTGRPNPTGGITIFTYTAKR